MSTETAVATARATVFNYDPAIKNWAPKGKGVSRIDLYFNSQTVSYRVIGRTQENEIVLNANILKNINYAKASETFHQWSDARSAYGLNFATKEDAANFHAAITAAIQKLNAAAPPMPATIPSPPPTSFSPSSSPAAPPTPAPAPPQPVTRTPNPPPAPASPGPASGPPPPPGGPAPPPPPPPGPSASHSDSGSGGGSLADQLARAKLRKTEPPPEPSLNLQSQGGSSGALTGGETAPAPKAPMGGVNMMDELQSRLKKKAMSSNVFAGSPPPPPSPGEDVPSPNPLPIKTPTTGAKLGTGPKPKASNEDIESIRQELKDLRQEFQQFKSEVEAILNMRQNS